MKLFHWDAARDQADCAFIEAEIFVQILRNKIRDSDDALAFGHGGIVEFFRLAREIIRRVACRHEMCLCFFAGTPCAPCRRTAADMDDINVVAFDEFFNPADILPHDEWVFGMHRQVDVNGANAGKLVNA